MSTAQTVISLLLIIGKIESWKHHGIRIKGLFFSKFAFPHVFNMTFEKTYITMSRSTRKPTLWTLRKVSTRISLSMPRRLTHTYIFRLIWIFFFRTRYSIPLYKCVYSTWLLTSYLHGQTAIIALVMNVKTMVTFLFLHPF